MATSNDTKAEGRLRLRFDADWRFLRNQDPKPFQGLGPFTWTWKPAEGVTLDVASLPSDLKGGAWREIPGRLDVLRGNTRFGWFRADVGSDPKNKSKVLRFISVDDNAVVFLNGKKIFTHRGWNDVFEVPVASAWKDGGPNELVLLVENTGGSGGVLAPITFETLAPKHAPKESAFNFDDSGWRVVHLPHDYVVEGTFAQGYNAGHGSLPTPTAWYRKTFEWPASRKGKVVYLDFDGIFRNAQIWLNGAKLGTQPSGYIGVRYDITKLVKPGAKNVVAAFVDPSKAEGWWYEGGGIYRHVWMTVCAPVHAKPWGTFVKASPQGKEGDPSPNAKVEVESEIANTTAKLLKCKVVHRVSGPDGKPVFEIAQERDLPAYRSTKVKGSAVFAKAQLWSIEKPNLYKLETIVLRGSKEVDRTETAFGVRSIRFDANEGFFLNGRPVKLMGTCNHQDHAGVGVAMPDALLEWRIKKLKEMGSNAYRCSHNPPAAELLDACDRLGMLVMDETRHLGDATDPKSGPGTKTTDLGELKSMVLRDRNHPSIIMWSLFNEEPLQGTKEGADIFVAMKKVVDRLDGTRPCTGAINHSYDSGIVDVNDLLGVNYNIEQYARMHERHPNTPVFGSETASTVSTRGIYANDAAKGYVSAYDLNHPGWGATAEGAWEPVAKDKWNFGAFVWTGYDYKGEPTPYGWPCINSHFGIMDICGFPKDVWWYYKAWWNGTDGQTPGKPMVHILPHWNWPGKEGQTVSVWCETNAERVELLLNDRSLGVKDVPRYRHVEWDVPYAPGTLKAVGTIRGRTACSDAVETAGDPAALKLIADRTVLKADDQDLAMVKVEVVDAKGRVVPTASNLVSFSLESPSGTRAADRGASAFSRILGVGNGDPSSHEPDKATQRSAFNGLCMVLVQATDKAGKCVLTAASPGLKQARLPLEVRR